MKLFLLLTTAFFHFHQPLQLFLFSVSSVAEISASLWESPYGNSVSTPVDCKTPITMPVEYFWGCESVAQDFNIIVSPVSSGDIVSPSATFNVEVQSLGFTNLTLGSSSNQFISSYETKAFYVFSNNQAESVQIDLEVTKGPASAQRFYNQLLNAFCPPCGCSEVSSKCNNSLIEYACTQAYRACNDNGLQTSICEDSCQDIEENCGYTFSEVGLPWLSCGHNFYYGDFDDVCEDIYGITETDGTDVFLWIVIVLVVLFGLLIFLGIIGFFGYKKFKAKNSYEKIEEVESD